MQFAVWTADREARVRALAGLLRCGLGQDSPLSKILKERGPAEEGRGGESALE